MYLNVAKLAKTFFTYKVYIINKELKIVFTLYSFAKRT